MVAVNALPGAPPSIAAAVTASGRGAEASAGVIKELGPAGHHPRCRRRLHRRAELNQSHVLALSGGGGQEGGMFVACSPPKTQRRRSPYLSPAAA